MLMFGCLDGLLIADKKIDVLGCLIHSNRNCCHCHKLVRWLWSSMCETQAYMHLYGRAWIRTIGLLHHLGKIENLRARNMRLVSVQIRGNALSRSCLIFAGSVHPFKGGNVLLVCPVLHLLGTRA